jgi:hypothetical protein
VRKELDKEKEETACNNGRLEGYEAGLREGYDVGLKKGEGNGKAKEEAWMMKHGRNCCIPLGTWLQGGVQCDEGVQTTPEDLTTANANVQTEATTTTNANIQTTSLLSPLTQAL